MAQLITDQVLDETVRLRRLGKLNLGDSLIAATAILHQAQVYTRNVSDFDWIGGFSVVDPLA